MSVAQNATLDSGCQRSIFLKDLARDGSRVPSGDAKSYEKAGTQFIAMNGGSPVSRLSS